ncbi:hypothetical protein LCGC14_2801050 [marine sediment metagenome]|uniref:Uncharacterized protein n=1 Tax=marine sediment metagenome TaxID=412755 RepID=A0A0F8YMM4_9ZZZZ
MTYDHKDSCMEWVEAHKWEDEDGKWWTAHEEHRTVPPQRFWRNCNDLDNQRRPAAEAI